MPVSGPNTSFDPKQVASLDAAAIDQMVATALVDITAATGLAELKDVRLAHSGDRSPLALANREIGALPPAAKAEVGKRRWRSSAMGGSSSRRPSTSRRPPIGTRWVRGIR
jgi:phenylalanyl-tRNA synthetase alpha chain